MPNLSNTHVCDRCGERNIKQGDFCLLTSRNFAEIDHQPVIRLCAECKKTFMVFFKGYLRKISLNLPVDARLKKI